MAGIVRMRITRVGIITTIVVLLLAGLVFGAIWWASERGREARLQDAVEGAIATQEAETNQPVVIAEDRPSSETTDETDTPETLPETGPADALPAVGAFLLTLTILSYLQSRKLTAS